MKSKKAKELALIVALLTEEQIINSCVINTFDRYFKVAKLFVKEYGLDNEQWEDTSYEEAVIDFGKKHL